MCRTKPGQECYAARNVEAQGPATYLPKLVERVATRERIRPMFPNYLFVEIAGRWLFLKSTFGISSVVTRYGMPDVVPEAVIRDLRGREVDGLVVLPELPDPRFVPGAKLRLRHGPLTNQCGWFSAVDGRDRVRILLEMLGRQTLTSVRRDHVILYAAVG